MQIATTMMVVRCFEVMSVHAGHSSITVSSQPVQHGGSKLTNNNSELGIIIHDLRENCRAWTEVCRHATGVHGCEWHVCLVMLDCQYNCMYVLKHTWVAKI